MKKGFTLIELLAVIVILAIIALIATPIVLDIINDAKNSATLRSADFYLEGVEQSISISTIKDKKIPDGEYEILETGNVCLKYENNVCKEILEIDVDGEVPKDGIITIKKGQIDNVKLVLNNKVIKKDEKGQLEFATTLTNHIKNLYSETKTTTVNGIEYSLDENNSLMNDRLGSSSVRKTGGNIRYYGKNPNNYIDIGDRDSQGNIIFWRIIGLFKDVEVTDENDKVIKKEDLVKIIRADKIENVGINVFSWDFKYDGTTTSYNNDWTTSTLQKLLNNEYYNSEKTIYYNYYRDIAQHFKLELNFVSFGLSSKAHKKMEKVHWSLGGHNTADVYTNEMYKYERKGTRKWSGKIGLMYPSDYGYSADLSSCQVVLSGYSDGLCKDLNWMYDSTAYQWALTPYSWNSQLLFYATSNGIVNYNSDTRATYTVRPVLYLKSDVSIMEEKETSDGIKYWVVE